MAAILVSGQSKPLPSERFKALLADPALREQFLPTMTPEEITAVERLLDTVVAEAERWCAEFDILPTQLILPTAVATIIELCDLPASAIAVRVVETLWIAAFDDVLDSRVHEDDIAALLRSCSDASLGLAAQGNATNQHALALWKIRNVLASRPAWQAMTTHWVASLLRLIDGMFYQYSIARLSVAPATFANIPLASYLHYAKHTLGFPHLLITSLILRDFVMTEPSFSFLVTLADQCGAVMRLANDLATFQREASEGTLNAIVLIAAQIEKATPRLPRKSARELAIAETRRMLQRETDEAHRMCQRLQTETHVARQFVRGMDFGVAMYAIKDFRDWTSTLPAAAIRP